RVLFRSDARHGGAAARGVGAHAAGRAQPRAQPPDVPGLVPDRAGAITPMFYAFREREELQEVMEELSGGRMHYMFNRVGGLKEDIPAGWPDRARRVVALVRRRVRDDIDTLVRGNEIFRARTRGVGVLSPEMAQSYGVSGP